MIIPVLTQSFPRFHLTNCRRTDGHRTKYDTKTYLFLRDWDDSGHKTIYILFDLIKSAVVLISQYKGDNQYLYSLLVPLQLPRLNKIL